MIDLSHVRSRFPALRREQDGRRATVREVRTPEAAVHALADAWRE